MTNDNFNDPDKKKKRRVVRGFGSGKSRFLNHKPVWDQFSVGLPVFIIDPSGTMLDNISDKIRRSPEDQETLWDRAIYVDMADTDPVCFPEDLKERINKISDENERSENNDD